MAFPYNITSFILIRQKCLKVFQLGVSSTKGENNLILNSKVITEHLELLIQDYPALEHTKKGY